MMVIRDRSETSLLRLQALESALAKPTKMENFKPGLNRVVIVFTFTVLGDGNSKQTKFPSFHGV